MTWIGTTLKYSRRSRPCFSEWISPASSSTRKCFSTAMRLTAKKRTTWLTRQPGLARTMSRMRRRLALASAWNTASIDSGSIGNLMVTYLTERCQAQTRNLRAGSVSDGCKTPSLTLPARRFTYCLLRQDPLHRRMLLDAGEAHVQPLELDRQPPVVDAEAVQNGGVHVVDVNGVFDDVVAE